MAQLAQYLKLLEALPACPTSSSARQLSDFANYLAMQALSQGKFDDARKYLSEAQRHSKVCKFRTAITLNNWACYYKYKGKPRWALEKIKLSIAILETISKQLPDKAKLKYLSDSYLNLAAILSQLGQHRQALQACKSATKSLQLELQSAEQGERFNVLAISYFNQGVEYQYLGNKALALQRFRRAESVLRSHCKPNQQLLAQISRAKAGCGRSRASSMVRSSKESCVSSTTPLRQKQLNIVESTKQIRKQQTGGRCKVKIRQLSMSLRKKSDIEIK